MSLVENAIHTILLWSLYTLVNVLLMKLIMCLYEAHAFVDSQKAIINFDITVHKIIYKLWYIHHKLIK